MSADGQDPQIPVNGPIPSAGNSSALPIPHDRSDTPPESYAAFAQAVLEARVRFSNRFDPSLFSDPAFDMLVSLFGATEEGRTMTTNNCCAASGVPRTTALRWIKLLVARGHVIATDDPEDRRSTLLTLSPTARTGIREWFEDCTTLPSRLAPFGVGAPDAHPAT